LGLTAALLMPETAPVKIKGSSASPPALPQSATAG
jgi:hypothetical protein